MNDGVSVRVETPDDAPAVAELLRACFPDEAVDDLVAALRAGPTHLPELALVAEDATGRPVGSVIVTTIRLERHPAAPQPILCLSPLAVHPDARGRGVARELVEEVLRRARDRARATGEPYLVLEGNPALYHRFGFVAASRYDLLAPSERIPPPAFQAVRLTTGDLPAGGRVLYSDPFWQVVTPGLPVDGPCHLDELERQCRLIEAALRTGGSDRDAGSDVLAGPVPTCPGWSVGALLDHLSTIARLVPAWLDGGRRPTLAPAPAPAGSSQLEGFGQAWRELHRRLSAGGRAAAADPAPTWSPWDGTLGFWRRRMAHEFAVHAFDLFDALGRGDAWSVPDDLAADGVDEALRLWLGTRLGPAVGGDGAAVTLHASSGGSVVRGWDVVLHQRFVEVHEPSAVAPGGSPRPGDALWAGDPADLYRAVWGRAVRGQVFWGQVFWGRATPDGGADGSAGVASSGSAAATGRLREALARATG